VWRLPTRLVLTLAQDGEREGEQEDKQQDQDPERDSLPHLASSLEYEPSRHSNPIAKARPAERTRVRPRVMYNVAMCSTLSPEAYEDWLALRAEFQGRGSPWPLISP
jgi:hypothetical protein